jgi:hypothetical protein
MFEYSNMAVVVEEHKTAHVLFDSVQDLHATPADEKKLLADTFEKKCTAVREAKDIEHDEAKSQCIDLGQNHFRVLRISLRILSETLFSVGTQPALVERQTAIRKAILDDASYVDRYSAWFHRDAKQLPPIRETCTAIANMMSIAIRTANESLMSDLFVDLKRERCMDEILDGGSAHGNHLTQALSELVKPRSPDARGIYAPKLVSIIEQILKNKGDCEKRVDEKIDAKHRSKLCGLLWKDSPERARCETTDGAFSFLKDVISIHPDFAAFVAPKLLLEHEDPSPRSKKLRADTPGLSDALRRFSLEIESEGKEPLSPPSDDGDDSFSPELAAGVEAFLSFRAKLREFTGRQETGSKSAPPLLRAPAPGKVLALRSMVQPAVSPASAPRISSTVRPDITPTSAPRIGSAGSAWTRGIASQSALAAASQRGQKRPRDEGQTQISP